VSVIGVGASRSSEDQIAADMNVLGYVERGD
jgi:hypothetical protein